MELWWRFLILIIGGYLIGNIFTARIISKIRKTDISKQGSGNPGTMNMLRTGGLPLALVNLFFDLMRGLIPALGGYYLLGGPGSEYGLIGLYTGGLAALIGNLFPVFYKFKGGKGASVVYGICWVVNWQLALIVMGAGIIYLLIFDYGAVVSLSLVTAFTVVQGIAAQGNIAISLLLIAIFCLMWWGFRQNVVRLLTGKESKVNFRASIAKLRSKRHMKKEEKLRRSNELG